jgi:transposase
MPKNTYSDEFKADAVRLYETTEGASYSSISEDLGIARGTLRSSPWKWCFCLSIKQAG